MAAWVSAAVHDVTANKSAIGSQGMLGAAGAGVVEAMGADVVVDELETFALVFVAVVFCASAVVKCMHTMAMQDKAQRARMPDGFLYS